MRSAPRSRASFCEHVLAAVGRAVVDDEHLARAAARARERERFADHARQVLALVERGYDNRQRRGKRDHGSVGRHESSTRSPSLVAACAVAGAGLAGCRGRHAVEMRGVPLAPISRSGSPTDQPLSSSTQSVNRYRSVLSRFDAVDCRLRCQERPAVVALRRQRRAADLVRYDNIDARFVRRFCPIRTARAPSPFDKLNLMLAEYSRNGVELSLQDGNSEYGYAATHGLFNDDEEYRFESGKVLPNPGARPKRMSPREQLLVPRAVGAERVRFGRRDVARVDDAPGARLLRAGARRRRHRRRRRRAARRARLSQDDSDASRSSFARLRDVARRSARFPSPSTPARRSAATRRRIRGARCSASSIASSARARK